MDYYRLILKCFEEIQNETNKIKIIERLDTCFNFVEDLLVIENSTNFLNALQTIKELIIQQKNKLNTKESLKEDLTDHKLPIGSSFHKTGNSNSGNSEIPLSKTECILQDIVPEVSGFEEIAGCEEIKTLFKTYFTLPEHQPQLFTDHMTTINSILLFGPPGTGKTRIVHALASEIRSKLYCISPSDIMSQYMGKAEKTIKKIFDQMKSAKMKSLLFIDEIDGICRKRNEQENETSRRIKTEIMCQLNNFPQYKNAIMVCATNCPWDIDSAFIRRFQKKIYIPLPDRNERFQLLHFFTRNTPLAKTKNEWGPIITQTEGFSASDMNNLVKTALHLPINELINNNMWKMSDINVYEPAVSQEMKNIIFCDISEIPDGCVKARQVQVADLIKSASQIKRTVSISEVMRFKYYVTDL